ncbi:hypothetical protein PHK61_22740 [Actinomycetospora lutea]|uniref:hypothetical protein n=1 Tax=Actinomycetospora lutea TaxID=663604 RepID=UPI0023672769|nr:hypothetical protein [Actinomycetospora lutea]MDD7941241.1 hypothetical protein [Actinomycetospora lutea]
MIDIREPHRSQLIYLTALTVDTNAEQGQHSGRLGCEEDAGMPEDVTTAATDTDPWTAGFEMGRLDQQLAALVLRDRPVGLTIRSVNRDEAAAIARRRGYGLDLRPVEESRGACGRCSRPSSAGSVLGSHEQRAHRRLPVDAAGQRVADDQLRAGDQQQSEQEDPDCGDDVAGEAGGRRS